VDDLRDRGLVSAIAITGDESSLRHFGTARHEVV
jgi:hypothetical protein